MLFACGAFGLGAMAQVTSVAAPVDTAAQTTLGESDQDIAAEAEVPPAAAPAQSPSTVETVAPAVVVAPAMVAAPEPVGAKISCGIVNLAVTGGDAVYAAKCNEELAALMNDMGFYTIFSQSVMESALKKVGDKFPRFCDDPRCVLDLGRSLQMERMVFGTVDLINNVCGVRLSLIDIPTQHTVQSVNIEGEPGLPAAEVLKVAVLRLHGQNDEDQANKIRAYFGPHVKNQQQWLVSSMVTIGGGLAFALANNSFGGYPTVRDFSTDAGTGINPGEIMISRFGRPSALANAYVALSDDAYGVLFNPAGSAWIAGPEAAAGYQNRFANMLTDVSVAYANKATREIGFGQGFFYLGDSLMSDAVFISSVSYKVNELFSFLRPFSVGAGVRLSSHTTTNKGLDATAGQRTFGFGLDVGLIWELADNIRYGVMVRDAYGMQRVNNTVTEYSYTEVFPALLRMGGTYQVGYSTLLIAEGQIPIYPDQSWEMSGAIEQEFFRVVKGRVGLQKYIDFTSPLKLTAGLGLEIPLQAMGWRFYSIDASYEFNSSYNEFFPVWNLSMKAGF